MEFIYNIILLLPTYFVAVSMHIGMRSGTAQTTCGGKYAVRTYITKLVSFLNNNLIELFCILFFLYIRRNRAILAKRVFDFI